MALNNKRFKIRIKKKSTIEETLDLTDKDLDSAENKPAKRRLFGRPKKQYKKVFYNQVGCNTNTVTLMTDQSPHLEYPLLDESQILYLLLLL